MGDYRNISTLVMAVALIQLAGGALGVIAPLGLRELGLGNVGIGVVSALHSAGFMIGAAFATRAIIIFGHIRVYTAAAAFGAVTCLAMGLTPDPYAWTFYRVAQGAAFAWVFASAESWMSDSISEATRGRVTSFYHVIAKLALLAGPFFVVSVSPSELQPFAICALFFALAVLPISLTRRGQPQQPEPNPLPFRQLVQLAPAAILGAFLAGLINTGTLALLPVYMTTPEMTDDTAGRTAALAMAAAWLGGLFSQWPAGRLSDAIDRRLVIAGLGLMSAGAALLLGTAHTLLGQFATLGLIALWGSGSLSFYGICVAHAIDWAKPSQFTQIMSGLLFVWAFGSVVGPPLFGVAMSSNLGAQGLFLLTFVLSLGLAAAMLARRTAREPPPETGQEPWEIAQPTSVIAGELDPRGDEADLEQ